jgi:hypothetical protein
MKYILVLLVFLSFISCKKEGCTDPLALNYDEKAKEDNGSCEYKDVIVFSFASLELADDTIAPGTSTNVTATVTGNGLTYSWTSSGGDLIGTGNVVSFAASPCMYGEYEISCTVSDYENNSEKKTVIISVYP